MGGYKEFIDNKISISMESGFDIDKEQLNNSLFEYQKDIVRWSLKKVDQQYSQIADLVKH